ncbi:hypothetical protein Tco_0114126, partial [Tanacetum coccineum]
VFVLNGGAVDWKSAKQSTTAMSSTEAGYIVVERPKAHDTELKLKEKFRELCEEVSNVVKEMEDVVHELERLSGNHVVHDFYKMMRLQIIVNESHLSDREKHTFVSKINLRTLI